MKADESSGRSSKGRRIVCPMLEGTPVVLSQALGQPTGFGSGSSTGAVAIDHDSFMIMIVIYDHKVVNMTACLLYTSDAADE